MPSTAAAAASLFLHLEVEFMVSLEDQSCNLLPSIAATALLSHAEVEFLLSFEDHSSIQRLIPTLVPRGEILGKSGGTIMYLVVFYCIPEAAAHSYSQRRNSWPVWRLSDAFGGSLFLLPLPHSCCTLRSHSWLACLTERDCVPRLN